MGPLVRTVGSVADFWVAHNEAPAKMEPQERLCKAGS